jgi:hypothetical protein
VFLSTTTGAGIHHFGFQLYYPKPGNQPVLSAQNPNPYQNFNVQPSSNTTSFTQSGTTWGTAAHWTGSGQAISGGSGINTAGGALTGVLYGPTSNYYQGIWNGTTANAITIAAGGAQPSTNVNNSNSGYIYNLQQYNNGSGQPYKTSGIPVTGGTANYAEFLVGTFTFTTNNTLGTTNIGLTQFNWQAGQSFDLLYYSSLSSNKPDLTANEMTPAIASIDVMSSVPEPPSVAALVGMLLTGGVLWLVYRRRSAKLAVAS